MNGICCVLGKFFLLLFVMLAAGCKQEFSAVAVSDVAVLKNRSVSINLSATNAPVGAVEYIVVSAPTNGIVTVESSTAVYVPSLDYLGPDSFSYIAKVGDVESLPGKVGIDVKSVIASPLKESVSFKVDEMWFYGGRLFLAGSSGTASSIGCEAPHIFVLSAYSDADVSIASAGLAQGNMISADLVEKCVPSPFSGVADLAKLPQLTVTIRNLAIARN